MKTAESSTRVICIFVKLKECGSDYVKSHIYKHITVLECPNRWAYWIVRSNDEATEAQRGEVTCPRSPSMSATGLKTWKCQSQMWGLGIRVAHLEGRPVVRAAPFPPWGLGEKIWMWPFPGGIAGEGGQARRHTTSPGRVTPLPLLPMQPLLLRLGSPEPSASPLSTPGQKPENGKLGKGTDPTWQLLATLRLYQFLLPPPNFVLGTF